MKIKICAFFILIFGIVFWGACSASKPNAKDLKRDPMVVLFVDAANYSIKLAKGGQLPGFKPDDHGIIRSSKLEGGKTMIEYPVRLILQMEKIAEENSIYWFTLEQLDKDGGWKVVEAWKTDVAGANRENLMKER